MEERSAIVAGGAGFVGSHLCARLLEMGYGRVICLDDLSTGSLSKIRTLLDAPRFIFLHEDVAEKVSYDGAITEIYNLACPPSPKQYRKDPIHTFETSVFGTVNLLKLALLHDASILLASTSIVSIYKTNCIIR